jgi:hypothetical protein
MEAVHLIYKLKEFAMKIFYQNIFIVLLVILFGCQQLQQTLTDVQKDTIKKEVKDQFNKLVTALNQKDDRININPFINK